MEYTPAGRSSAFTLPELTDAADLQAILQAFADDALNAHGDVVTGDYSVTGTVNATTLQQGGVGVVLTTNTGVLKVVTSSTRPGSPSEGQMIWETDTNLTLQWNGTTWVSVGGGGGGASYSDLFLMMGA
jgi:hydrogenase maturation factor